MLPLRLNRRFFTLFAVLMLCMSFLTITASAEANPPNVPFGQYKVNDPAYNKLGFKGI